VLIGRQDVLPLLFQEVIIPEAVFRELQNTATPAAVRHWLANPPLWLKVKLPAAPLDASLLLLDEGERDAIRLAEELNASLLIIDERLGREEALRRKLPVVGTLGILEQAAERERLDFAQMLTELKAHKFFISPALERDFLDRDTQRKARQEKSPKTPTSPDEI
jgi:predicted nucleic acid-binding protein